MKKEESFIISRIFRQDLEMAGFKGIKVDDATMEELAEAMGNAYCDNTFWQDLAIIAEELGIPKKRQ